MTAHHDDNIQVVLSADNDSATVMAKHDDNIQAFLSADNEDGTVAKKMGKKILSAFD